MHAVWNMILLPICLVSVNSTSTSKMKQISSCMATIHCKKKLATFYDIRALQCRGKQEFALLVGVSFISRYFSFGFRFEINSPFTAYLSRPRLVLSFFFWPMLRGYRVLKQKSAPLPHTHPSTCQTPYTTLLTVMNSWNRCSTRRTGASTTWRS